MKRTLLTALSIALAAALNAEPVCVGDACYPSREAAIEAGALPPGSGAEGGARVAFGYMRPSEFAAFLRGESKDESPLAEKSTLAVILLVLLGGLLANLTPCVLPLVPVNVAILLGRAESTRAGRIARGLAYGSGMAVSYGALGLAAAFGGLAFGAVQSSPWFNASVAAVFIVLGLGMAGFVNIDPAAMWRRFASSGRAASPSTRAGQRGLGSAFLLGAGASVLAGACVQPILLATLVYTAEGFAAGRLWTISLPFLLGVGMGLPWVFVAAGISILPKPGAWMAWVKRGFAAMMFAMSAWYGHLAWLGFRHAGSAPLAETQSAGRPLDAVPDTWSRAIAAARSAGKPVLVDIWATWCKNCLAMETTTFKDAKVVECLKDFTVIRLQTEDMAKLADIPELRGLGIKGLPAAVILEPAKNENEEH